MVSRKSGRLGIVAVLLWLMGGLAAQAQHMQQIAGASLTQIAVGSPWNIWGINKAQQIFQFNSATQTFNQVPGYLMQIAVGGGTMQQADAIWGVASNKQIYQYTNGTWVQVPGLLASISVGTGHGNCYPYEVWGVNNSYAYRFNFCTRNWEVGASYFESVVSAGGEVWAIGNNSSAYQFNFSTLTFNQIPSSVYQISIAGGGGAVFALHQTFPYPILYEFDAGAQSFFQVPGTVKSIAAGGNDIWGISPGNGLWRLSPTSQTWTTVPGSYSQVVVGNGGGGVWALDTSGNVYTFVTP